MKETHVSLANSDKQILIEDREKSKKTNLSVVKVRGSEISTYAVI